MIPHIKMLLFLVMCVMYNIAFSIDVFQNSVDIAILYQDIDIDLIAFSFCWNSTRLLVPVLYFCTNRLC